MFKPFSQSFRKILCCGIFSIIAVCFLSLTAKPTYASRALPEKVESDIEALTVKLRSLLPQDIVFRQRSLESQFLESGCGTDPWQVILLAIIHINNENYDDIAPVIEVLNSCQRPLEYGIEEVGQVLSLFAQAVAVGEAGFADWRESERLSQWETPSAQFLHDVLAGYLYALEGKNFTALTMIKNAQLTFGVKNTEPVVWLLGMWIEAYLYATLSDLSSLVLAYNNITEFSAIKNLPIDFGTTLYNISFLAQELGGQEIAVSLYREMESLYLEVNDSYNLFATNYGMAILYIDLEEYELARERFEKAREYEDAAPSYFIGSSELMWAFAESRLGNLESAQWHLQRANELFAENLSLVPDEALLAKRRVDADIANGRGDSAEAYRLLSAYHREVIQKLILDYNNQFMNAHQDFVRQFRTKEERIVRGSETIIFQRLLIILTIVLLLALTASLAMMRRSEKRARNAAAQKSLLLASVSHELRTPLNAILGFAEVLDSEVYGSIGGEKNKEYVGYIVSSGRHLRDLINQVMNVTTVAKRKKRATSKEIDLHNLAKEVSESFTQEIEKKRLKLKVEVKFDRSIVSDATLIRQILINLLSNAIKFTREGGTILLSLAERRRKILVIKIKDDGIGMNSEEITLATDIFWRSKNGYNSDSSGSGLGLSIVKNIVENLGGKLSIASARGIGTAVTVNIPF